MKYEDVELGVLYKETPSSSWEVYIFYNKQPDYYSVMAITPFERDFQITSRKINRSTWDFQQEIWHNLKKVERDDTFRQAIIDHCFGDVFALEWTHPESF